MIKDEMYEVNCSHWYLLEGIIHIRIVCYIYVVDHVRVGSFSDIKFANCTRRAGFGWTPY